MLRQEFLYFFKNFTLKKWFCRKPELESPYTEISKRLVGMIAHYSDKRFARKIVSSIPKEIFEKLDDEKIEKLEQKLILEVEKALKKVNVQHTLITYNEIIHSPQFFYCFIVYREERRNAVKEVFSEKSLREIVGS